jgi:hypothetical protein
MTFMSSPKGAAAKTARRPRAAAVPPAKPGVKPSVKIADGTSAQATRLAAEIERAIADGRLDVLTNEALQALMAAVCRAYAARTEAGEQSLPLPKNAVSATDVMVSASGLLRAADLAVFELGMWQSWTGR